jgi:hypothetical protein
MRRTADTTRNDVPLNGVVRSGPTAYRMSSELTVTGGRARTSLDRPHLGKPFKIERVRRADTEQPWTQPDRPQGARFDLFVNLFSADKPILRELANSYPRLAMRSQSLNLVSPMLCPFFVSLRHKSLRDRRLPTRHARTM